jgi:hypothetical protein
MDSAVPLNFTAKNFLPGNVRLRAAVLWQSRKDVAWFCRTGVRHGCPERILHFGIAPGDDLLCTTVARELTKRGAKKIWMMSKNAELFQNSRDVEKVVPVDYRFREYAWVRGKKWQQLEYSRMDLERDMSVPPPRHILAELCARAEISGRVALRPYFYLTNEERAKSAWADGTIAIQSSGLGGQMMMRNKQWFPERFQAVVNALKNDFKFVQLGSTNDPLLANVDDRRGKTTMRESAAILANAKLFLGNVGFLMHLARAVECPSVVIFGGREAPWQSGYSCNENLYTAEPCAPCWLWNKCDFNRVCMDKISAAAVVDAVKKLVARPRAALTVDEVEL